MSDTARTPLLTARWLALGAAGGAAVALALEQAGLHGPWQVSALVLVLLAIFALLATLLALRKRESLLQDVSQRAQRGEDEVHALHREIMRHNELEMELTKAKQTAEAAVLAKGEFLATMSHEIRTPLNGIVPMLDLLMNARLLPDQKELVRTAFASSHQLLRIVDDILDYSKLEANRLELETTTFNLRELLEGVLQLMERPAEAKGLRLHLQLDPSVRLPVRGDPVRLRQVLSNLLGNAVKFTERGSVSLAVNRIGETVAQHQLRFEVRDTGIGISGEAQARLFKAFTQADASTTRLYGGTGLGLAICKRIVDLMGGRIGVESESQRGALFWFEVPMLKVQGDIRGSEVELGSARLLLLTSDPILRKRMSMVLPNWGLRITSVETTQEALDRMRAAAAQGAPWNYDIVLADLPSIRTTAVALHRNLGRRSMYGDVLQVYLQGDQPAPPELHESAIVIPRNAPDADLRMALATATRPDTKASLPAPVEKPARGSRRWQGRVLLVEDNPVNLLVAQRLLSVMGVECDTAVNGEAALQRMSSARYELVLMDCQMPVLDGYAATRRWRELESEKADRHLPIVAMTANAMAGDRQRCLDAGMDDYLAKPVTRGELESCLHRWLAPVADGEEPFQPESDAPFVATESTPPPALEAAVPAPPRPPVPVEPTPAARPAAATGRIDDGQAGTGIPILDEEVLEELRSVLGDELEQIIRVFLEDAPRLIAQLESAALAPDLAAMREAAHTLKSASANLGAMLLSAAAKRIEHGARTQSLDRPAVAVALLVTEFARVRVALQARLQAADAA